jgi:hypothetical protein
MKIKVPRFECPRCGCRHIRYRGDYHKPRYHNEVQCLHCCSWYVHNPKDVEEVTCENKLGGPGATGP